ncbi:MAG: hypothetical protein EXR67_01450 [Dehalococcoidia bacterium]|nr:hypothetical protein [Dehalococcoidia bacterium]
MSNLRILLATVLALSLALVPAFVSAQSTSPHGFYGKARIDGVAASANTKVAATVDGMEVASANTDATGDYILMIVETVAGQLTGKTIKFTIGTFSATQSAQFTAFNNERKDLNANSGPAAAATATVAPTTGPGNVVVVSGSRFSAGSPVTLTVPGGPAATTNVVTVAPNGSFSAVAVLPSSAAGAYVITAADNAGRTATTTYTIGAGASGAAGAQGAVGPAGTAGPAGIAGVAGAAGKAGADGKAGAIGAAGPAGQDAASGLAVIALVVAIVAAVIALASVFIMRKPKNA